MSLTERTEPQLDFVAGLIAPQSQHLKRLIDDLLDVGRAMTGKIILASAPLDLAASVRHVVSLREASWASRTNLRLPLPDPARARYGSRSGPRGGPRCGGAGHGAHTDPRNTETPNLNWQLVPIPTPFDTTPYADQYLVFWVVVWMEDASGRFVGEMPGHGLHAIPGTLTSFADVAALEDSHGNNVGFYKSAFYVFPKPSRSLVAKKKPGSAVQDGIADCFRP